MGRTGRVLNEKEWPFSAEIQAIKGSLAGSAVIVAGINGECAPQPPPDVAPLEVEVLEGDVVIGGGVYHFPGNTVTVSENNSGHHRLDLIYIELEALPTGPTLKKIEGTAAEEPKVPDVPGTDSLPVAVIGMRPYSDEITYLYDCRCVPSAKHGHGSGDALSLHSTDVKMKVKADEDSMTVQNDEVEVLDAGDAELDLTYGKGLKVNVDEVSVDRAHGLGFEGEKLKVTPADFAGLGLSGDGDLLSIKEGDGVSATYMGTPSTVGVDVGKGFHTSTGALEVDILTDGGLDFDGDQLKVDAGDFSSSGLEIDGSDIKVAPGGGVEVDFGRVNVDYGKGLRTHDPEGESTGEWVFEAYPDPYGNINFDADGKLIAEYETLAGDGLYGESGELHFDAGDGLKIDTKGVTIKEGDGVSATTLGLKIYRTSNEGLEFDADDRLFVEPADFLGGGVKDESGDIGLDIGDGLTVSSGETTIDQASMVEVNSTEDEAEFIPVAGTYDPLFEEDGKLKTSLSEMEKDYADTFEEVLSVETTISYGARHRYYIADAYRGQPLWVFIGPRDPPQHPGIISWTLKMEDDQYVGTYNPHCAVLDIKNLEESEIPFATWADQDLEYRLVVMTAKWQDD